MKTALPSFNLATRDGVASVQIKPSRARGCTVAFYAPGFRAMGFATLERAMRKAERLPGFRQWCFRVAGEPLRAVGQ